MKEILRRLKVSDKSEEGIKAISLNSRQYEYTEAAAYSSTHRQVLAVTIKQSS